jgi:hypothetical protein
MKELEIVLKELKLQHELRLENIKANKEHVASSWIKTKERLVETIKKEHPNYIRDYIDTIIES